MKQFLLASALSVFSATAANAGVVVSSSADIMISVDQAAPLDAEAAFLASLDTSVTESFEGFAVGGGLTTLSTAVGEFNAVAAGQQGLQFAIGAGNITGREGVAGPQFFESLDLVSVTLDIAGLGFDFDALGFFLQDPSDQGATFEILFADGELASAFVQFESEPNGQLSYISAMFAKPIAQLTVSFANIDNDQNDGFGLDDITVGRKVSEVSEPGLLGLFGLGFLGLGFAARRRS